MSAPSALTVVYPPSFQNSFWSSPSYRKGAQSLYARLQAGIDEAESILAFVAHRAELEYKHAEALATPAPLPTFSPPLFKTSGGGLLSEVIGSPVLGGGSSPFADGPRGIDSSTRGFVSNQTGSSHIFRLIQAETTAAQANAHGKVARSLERLILDPFSKWSLHHKERVSSSWDHVDAALTRFERQKSEVDKLKLSYEKKCRNADEAEDDAKFAPVDDHSYDATTPPQRSISASSSTSLPDASEKDGEEAATAPDPERLKRRETLRKQFGFNRVVSAGGQPSASKEFAGIKLPTPPGESDKANEELPHTSSGEVPSSNGTGMKRSGTIGAYLHSAVERMPTPLKAAVGGVVSNEAKHVRLRRDADNAERVYEESVRNLDRTRCQVEEILYEHFGLTQKWESDRIRAIKTVLSSYNTALSSGLPALDQSVARCVQLQESLQPELELRALIRGARTGPFQPAIERFQPYYHDEISLGRSITGQSEASGWMTKNGGFGLDLVLVERLDFLEKMERDGVNAISSSTKLAPIPPVLEALLAALKRAYADDQRWPNALAAASAAQAAAASDAAAAVDEGEGSVLLIRSQEKRKTWIYEVPLNVTHRLRDALIAQLSPSHADMIYGNQSGSEGKDTASGSRLISDKMLDAYDPPVLAACIKIWMLELEKSLVIDDLWDQIDAVYRAAAGQEQEALDAINKEKGADAVGQPAVGSAPEDASDKGRKGKAASASLKVDLATEEKIRQGVLEDLAVVLGKLPKMHLACLDAVVRHLSELLKETKTDESDLVYLNKVGLALGRAVIRPRNETPYTLAARHPTLLVMDLIQYYDQIFPPLVEKKLREHLPSTALVDDATGHSNGLSSAAAGGQRKTPIRKRTKPVDQRISRSSIGRDLQEGAKRLAEQVGERLATSPRPPAKDNTPPVPTKPDGETNGSDPQESFSTPTEELAAPSIPAIDTSKLGAASAAKAADNEAAPTPLAQRVFTPNASTPVPPSTQPTQPDEGRNDDDNDKPLSNVARLSRQFASGGSLSKTSTVGSGGVPSGASAVRGPRPAGARSARLSHNFSSASSQSAKRESVDLAPSTAGEENDRRDRRRSWSRTIEASDALVDE